MVALSTLAAAIICPILGQTPPPILNRMRGGCTAPRRTEAGWCCGNTRHIAFLSMQAVADEEPGSISIWKEAGAQRRNAFEPSTSQTRRRRGCSWWPSPPSLRPSSARSSVRPPPENCMRGGCTAPRRTETGCCCGNTRHIACLIMQAVERLR